MTVQFSRQAIAALSGSLVKTGAGLVRRLVRARNDPGKERIRKWLIDLDDAQLQSGLGLTLEDIAVLRDGTSRTCQTEIYRRERQAQDTDRPRTRSALPSLRTRPNPILARLPSETFGID